MCGSFVTIVWPFLRSHWQYWQQLMSCCVTCVNHIEEGLWPRPCKCKSNRYNFHLFLFGDIISNLINILYIYIIYISIRSYAEHFILQKHTYIYTFSLHQYNLWTTHIIKSKNTNKPMHNGQKSSQTITRNCIPQRYLKRQHRYIVKVIWQHNIRYSVKVVWQHNIRYGAKVVW